MKKPEKIVVAIDSFKGSLSTFESGEALKEAVSEVFPEAICEVYPLADGGEGTMEAIIYSRGGMAVSLKVKDPLGEDIYAEYGLTKDGLAVIEAARAAGITLIPPEKRNPLYTTTFGVGQLIRHAIVKGGCRKFIIGIGGSATNDGGIGMLSALGFKFLDENGEQVSCLGRGLEDIKEIRTDEALPELSECEFLVACDVKNPLCGELGCSAVYGPQKGATPEIIQDMDTWLSNYASLTKSVISDADPTYPGAGAAGGLGFAFLSYLGAKLCPGTELIMETTGLSEKIKDADLVITGEGKLDSQSAMGKAPVGVAREAKKYGKPVIAFSGCIGDGAEACNKAGIDAYFPILQAPVSLSEAMDVENAYKNLKNTAAQVLRLIDTFIK